MKKKNTRNVTMFLVFFFLSGSSAFLKTVEKLVDFEFYYEIASYSLVEIVHLGKREKSTADALTKQTVHSYLVTFAWRWYFHIFHFFFDLSNFQVRRV